MKKFIQELYQGESERAVRFRYGLLIFDVVTLLFLFTSSFYYGTDLVALLDIIFGVFILSDFLARLWIARERSSFLISPYGIADMIVIISLLLPLLGENLAFMRVFRVLRLLRSYQVIRHLRRDFSFFKRNEDVIISIVNLALFIFVMTALVFETQVEHNAQITNYVDALYFTVTTLTTTGFGDITLEGTNGRLIAIAVMIFGVSLFIRLIQTIFRPSKVRFACPDCGLFLHDRDAIHCKHCGRTLNIPDPGLV